MPASAGTGDYNVPMIASAPPAAQALVSDLQRVFGDRLRAVVAYGPQLEGQSGAPMTSLALVSGLTPTDLEACAALASKWTRTGVNTPLLIPEDEFRGSLDAFPLEYGEIIRAHIVLFGENPFAGIAIAPGDLRRACETQVKSHLVHLRQSFVETRGDPGAISGLVRAAAPAFAALLRNVARLGNVHTSDRLEATRAGARLAGVSDNVVSEVLALDGPSTLAMSDQARFFGTYLSAVEQLARAVDSWHN
jgi:hypothetical protein